MRIDPSDLDATALYRLMISVVVPRPIAWVSSCSPDGLANAAPFSYFQALSAAPPSLMISVGRRRDGSPKDTRANIEATGEFVVNLVSEASAVRMVRCSKDFEPGTSEFDEIGLEEEPSEMVAPPRIAESAVSMECRLDRVIEIGPSAVIFGQVVLFHVKDEVLDGEGTVDPVLLRPLARLGGTGYAPLREVIEIHGSDGVATVQSELLHLWSEFRVRTIAMARSFETKHLERRLGDAGMTVGRTLRHLAGCTGYRVLVWEGREEEDELREWDLSWTGERLAQELEQDRRDFLTAARQRLPAEPYRTDVQHMLRHEAWHQGQIAAALRGAFDENALWFL